MDDPLFLIDPERAEDFFVLDPDLAGFFLIDPERAEDLLDPPRLDCAYKSFLLTFKTKFVTGRKTKNKISDFIKNTDNTYNLLLFFLYIFIKYTSSSPPIVS